MRNYKAGMGVTMRYGSNGFAIDGALASADVAELRAESTAGESSTETSEVRVMSV